MWMFMDNSDEPTASQKPHRNSTLWNPSHPVQRYQTLSYANINHAITITLSFKCSTLESNVDYFPITAYPKATDDDFLFMKFHL